MIKALALLLPCALVACNPFVSSQEENIVSQGDGLATQSAVAQGRYRTSALFHAQVLLDRAGFSPGVIDGKQGQSFTLALRGFQTARQLSVTGKLDDPTRAVLLKEQNAVPTLMIRISASFANGPFVPSLPKDTARQAKLARLGYRNVMEALAERFHTTQETLLTLNAPTTLIGAGTIIRVPNIGKPDMTGIDPDRPEWRDTLVSLGVSAMQPMADRIVVDKSDGALRVFDANDDLIAQFPATMGSKHDPLPIGRWKIQGVSYNPTFHYDPKLFWNVSDSKDAALLPPGPNGPVGIVWIDLSKPHYGIHGTPEPETIGRAESHGCIRLTNWDAARLAQMVHFDTPAMFQP
ncbi:MAG: murein L,D-transpeptidase [Alphaproteobacteria bacterium]|nr:murein L,D-transpeptidase [Alphaproteobacteria bacterium]